MTTKVGSSPSGSGCVKRLRLGIEGFALGTLATHRAETFDSKLLPGRHHGIEPLLHELLDRLALGVHLLADNLASLVLHQLGLREATRGLFLAATEDDGLRALARCDLGHGLLLHGLHCLGLHGGFGLHSAGLHHLLHSGLHCGTLPSELEDR